jgi:hypothetical protein
MNGEQTRLHLETVRTHIVEAGRIFEIFELDVTDLERDTILEYLEVAENVVTEIIDDVTADAELEFLEEKMRGS